MRESLSYSGALSEPTPGGRAPSNPAPQATGKVPQAALPQAAPAATPAIDPAHVAAARKALPSSPPPVAAERLGRLSDYLETVPGLARWVASHGEYDRGGGVRLPLTGHLEELAREAGHHPYLLSHFDPSHPMALPSAHDAGRALERHHDRAGRPLEIPLKGDPQDFLKRLYGLHQQRQDAAGGPHADPEFTVPARRLHEGPTLSPGHLTYLRGEDGKVHAVGNVRAVGGGPGDQRVTVRLQPHYEQTRAPLHREAYDAGYAASLAEPRGITGYATDPAGRDHDIEIPPGASLARLREELARWGHRDREWSRAAAAFAPNSIAAARGAGVSPDFLQELRDRVAEGERHLGYQEHPDAEVGRHFGRGERDARALRPRGHSAAALHQEADPQAAGQDWKVTAAYARGQRPGVRDLIRDALVRNGRTAAWSGAVAGGLVDEFGDTIYRDWLAALRQDPHAGPEDLQRLVQKVVDREYPPGTRTALYARDAAPEPTPPEEPPCEAARLAPEGKDTAAAVYRRLTGWLPYAAGQPEPLLPGARPRQGPGLTPGAFAKEGEGQLRPAAEHAQGIAGVDLPTVTMPQPPALGKTPRAPKAPARPLAERQAAAGKGPAQRLTEKPDLEAAGEQPPLTPPVPEGELPPAVPRGKLGAYLKRPDADLFALFQEGGHDFGASHARDDAALRRHLRELPNTQFFAAVADLAQAAASKSPHAEVARGHALDALAERPEGPRLPADDPAAGRARVFDLSGLGEEEQAEARAALKALPSVEGAPDARLVPAGLRRPLEKLLAGEGGKLKTVSLADAREAQAAAEAAARAAESLAGAKGKEFWAEAGRLMGESPHLRGLVLEQALARKPGQKVWPDEGSLGRVRVVDTSKLKGGDRERADGLLARLDRVPGVEGAVHVPEGLDLKGLLGKGVRERPLDPGEVADIAARAPRHGLEPSLRVRVEGFTPRPGDKGLPVKTTNRNAARQLEIVDRALSRHPDPASSPQAWAHLMADALGDDDVPVPPYRLIQRYNRPQEMVRELVELTPGQLQDADHGFKNAAAFRKLYRDGKVSVETTGKILLWSYLSRGVSPYAQESMFLDAVGGIEPWVRLAAAGKFNGGALRRYEAWADRAAPKGSGLPGAGTVHNLHSFGEHFLTRLSERGEDGRTGLGRLHDLIASDSSGPEVRREFLKMGEGVGIDNKVLSFTLLVTGRGDILVLDRVQIRNQYDDGRFAGRNLYDGQKYPEVALPGGGVREFPAGPEGQAAAKAFAKANDGEVEMVLVPGTSFAPQTMGARGLVLYEAMERALARRLPEVYAKLGRPRDGTLGRYHWESWVVGSQQEASHGTLSALLREARGEKNPYVGVTSKEGEYATYHYGVRYGRDGKNRPYQLYSTSQGDVYRFEPREFQDFVKVLQTRKAGVVPRNFKLKNSGNQPWFLQPGVDRERLDELVRQFGRPVTDPVGRGTAETHARHKLADLPGRARGGDGGRPDPGGDPAAGEGLRADGGGRALGRGDPAPARDRAEVGLARDGGDPEAYAVPPGGTPPAPGHGHEVSAHPVTGHFHYHPPAAGAAPNLAYSPGYHSAEEAHRAAGIWHASGSVARPGFHSPAPAAAPAAAAPVYGKAKLRNVEIYPAAQPLLAALAPRLTPGALDDPAETLLSAAGAPDDAHLGRILPHTDDPDDLMVHWFHPHLRADEPWGERGEGGGPVQRRVGVDPLGRPYIENEYFWVKAAHQGGGLGARSFARAAEQAREAGFRYIKAHAAKANPLEPANPHIGYYFWPLMGYDLPFATLERRKRYSSEPVAPADVVRDARRLFPGSDSVLDLVQTPEGRKWWKANGVDLHGARFDLTPGSPSWRQQERYRRERAAAGKPFARRGEAARYGAGG